jgi:hypothetical protein
MAAIESEERVFSLAPKLYKGEPTTSKIVVDNYIAACKLETVLQ